MDGTIIISYFGGSNNIFANYNLFVNMIGLTFTDG